MKFKKIIAVLLEVIIICSMTAFNVSALSMTNNTIDISEMLDNVIPDDVYYYAQNRLLPLATTVQNDYEDFGIEIENINKISLGTPYVIYNALSVGDQNCIYYFPVQEGNTIKCVLSVSENNGIYSASLSEDIADELNDIKYAYDNNYIFYYDTENIYAENTTEGTEKLNAVIDNNYTVNFEQNLKSFQDLSFYQKVQQISNTYGKNSDKLSTNTVSAFDNAKGFSSKASTNVRLNTSGCLVPQYSDGNCWAASVATTLRYLNYSKFSKLTARNVCDKIGVGYNEGGNLVTRQKALIAYGITYYNHFLSYPMEFDLIQKNILNQSPILASCVGLKSGNGHAVTGIGYTTYGGIKQVVFYNSGNNKCVTSEYKTTGLTFSYNNESFRWRSSLSCY